MLNNPADNNRHPRLIAYQIFNAIGYGHPANGAKIHAKKGGLKMGPIP